MPLINSDGDPVRYIYHYEPKKNFRTEMAQVRKLVIDYKLENSSMETTHHIVKVVTAIDELESALAALAYYIRHEDTREDDREREEEERQRTRDRELEIQHARNTY